MASREAQKIAEMCWESYVPLVEKAVRGKARAADWALLNKLLLEDYDSHTEVGLGDTPYLLEALVWRMVVLVSRRHWEDDLYEAVSAGVWDQILAMQVWEKHYPELVRPICLEASLERAQRLKRQLLRWISNLHDGELYHFSFEEFAKGVVAAVRRRHVAFLSQIERRCAVYKEELMAAAWAPARVERWLEAGANLEDC